jgi:hypothetical protein
MMTEERQESLAALDCFLASSAAVRARFMPTAAERQRCLPVDLS